MTPPLVMCSWCGDEPSEGKHQGSECCEACRVGGRVVRIRMAMQRWKRSAQQKETA